MTKLCVHVHIYDSRPVGVFQIIELFSSQSSRTGVVKTVHGDIYIPAGKILKCPRVPGIVCGYRSLYIPSARIISTQPRT